VDGGESDGAGDGDKYKFITITTARKEEDYPRL